MVFCCGRLGVLVGWPVSTVSNPGTLISEPRLCPGWLDCLLHSWGVVLRALVH